MANSIDLYSLLNISRSASPNDIQQELNGRISTMRGQGATDNDTPMQQSFAALSILGDPELKKLYDARLPGSSAPPMTPGPCRSSPSSGNSATGSRTAAPTAPMTRTVTRPRSSGAHPGSRPRGPLPPRGG